jgi:hypothetical protein
MDTTSATSSGAKHDTSPVTEVVNMLQSDRVDARVSGLHALVPLILQDIPKMQVRWARTLCVDEVVLFY